MKRSTLEEVKTVRSFMKKTVLRKNGLEIAPLTTESKRTTAEVKQPILIDIANPRKKENIPTKRE